MKRPGCIISLLIAVGILGCGAYAWKKAITPRNISQEDPRHAFEALVTSPIPPSVHEIAASGTLAMVGGGHIFIDFRLDPEDADRLIRQGMFRPADQNAPGWVETYQPEDAEGKVSRHVRDNESTKTTTALFLSADRKRGWFREIHL